MRTIPKLPADVIKGTVPVVVYPAVLEATCGLALPAGPAATLPPPGIEVLAETIF